MLYGGYKGQYHLGVDLEEADRQKLEYLTETFQMGRSQLIRNAIRALYQQIKDKEAQNNDSV